MLRRTLLLISLLALAACGNGTVKEKLGLDKNAPDEFRVVSRPPLSMPPDFDLRPPQPGEPSVRAGGPASSDEAHALVVNGKASSTAPTTLSSGAFSAPPETAVTPVTSAPLASAGESKLLANAGATLKDPTVRDKIYRDSLPAAQPKNRSTWFGLWSNSDPVVDSKGEADRIKADKATGKPVTTGETPTKQPSHGSVLSNIFGGGSSEQ